MSLFVGVVLLVARCPVSEPVSATMMLMLLLSPSTSGLRSSVSRSSYHDPPGGRSTVARFAVDGVSSLLGHGDARGESSGVCFPRPAKFYLDG